MFRRGYNNQSKNAKDEIPSDQMKPEKKNKPSVYDSLAKISSAIGSNTAGASEGGNDNKNKSKTKRPDAGVGIVRFGPESHSRPDSRSRSKSRGGGVESRSRSTSANRDKKKRLDTTPQRLRHERSRVDDTPSHLLLKDEEYRRRQFESDKVNNTNVRKSRRNSKKKTGDDVEKTSPQKKQRKKKKRSSGSGKENQLSDETKKVIDLTKMLSSPSLVKSKKVRNSVAEAVKLTADASIPHSPQARIRRASISGSPPSAELSLDDLMSPARDAARSSPKERVMSHSDLDESLHGSKSSLGMSFSRIARTLSPVPNSSKARQMTATRELEVSSGKKALGKSSLHSMTFRPFAMVKQKSWGGKPSFWRSEGKAGDAQEAEGPDFSGNIKKGKTQLHIPRSTSAECIRRLPEASTSEENRLALPASKDPCPLSMVVSATRDLANKVGGGPLLQFAQKTMQHESVPEDDPTGSLAPEEFESMILSMNAKSLEIPDASVPGEGQQGHSSMSSMLQFVPGANLDMVNGDCVKISRSSRGECNGEVDGDKEDKNEDHGTVDPGRLLTKQNSRGRTGRGGSEELNDSTHSVRRRRSSRSRSRSKSRTREKQEGPRNGGAVGSRRVESFRQRRASMSATSTSAASCALMERRGGRVRSRSDVFYGDNVANLDKQQTTDAPTRPQRERRASASAATVAASSTFIDKKCGRAVPGRNRSDSKRNQTREKAHSARRTAELAEDQDDEEVMDSGLFNSNSELKQPENSRRENKQVRERPTLSRRPSLSNSRRSLSSARLMMSNSSISMSREQTSAAPTSRKSRPVSGNVDSGSRNVVSALTKMQSASNLAAPVQW